MIKPQALAGELAQMKHLQTIADNACCAFVFLYCLGLDVTDIEAIKLVENAINKKWIDQDATVWWQVWGEKLTGRNILATFYDNPTEAQLKGLVNDTPVYFEYVGDDGEMHGHWYAFKRGKCTFDPLGQGNSVSIKKGRPTKMRIIQF